MKALANHDGHDTCVAIEKKYGVYGYPPEIVTAELQAAAEQEAQDNSQFGVGA